MSDIEKRPEPWNGMDPVCGMKVNSESPHRYHYQGIEYGFCSDSCLNKFHAQPEHYLQPELKIDPVCGMTVSEDSQYRFDVEGVEYLFCSEGCQNKFSVDPSHYLNSSDKKDEQSPHHAVHPKEENAVSRSRCDLHLSNASGNSASPSRSLSQVWHGSRTYGQTNIGEQDRIYLSHAS